MNDIDVSGRMTRDEFENLSSDLFDRLRHLIQELLHNARELQAGDTCPHCTFIRARNHFVFLSVTSKFEHK